MMPRTPFPFTGLFAVLVAIASTGASAPGETENNAATTTAPSAAAPRLVFAQLGQDVSLRGLSVVDDRVVWVSGEKGTIALSTDGARSFQLRKPPEFAGRNLYASDPALREAVLREGAAWVDARAEALGAAAGS
jgi:hypothetical protein